MESPDRTSPPHVRAWPLRRWLGHWLLPYLPYPHFMALAPLDAVARVLARPAWIRPRFWPRLVLLLALSALATIVSLPERVALGLYLRWRPPRIAQHQAPIFVLGHARSGTTFLQTLLATDPMLRTPRWAEVLAPQAFVILWTVLRFLLIPFLPLTAVTRVVPLSPGGPGEDEFAVNNWSAASLIAGLAVRPQAQAFYDRFHDLDGLTGAELARWRKYQHAFVAKIMLTAGGRRLLLKSPAHMARVAHLRDLFPGAKFVHISRPPAAVFQSNLRLARTLQDAFALDPPLPDDEQEELAIRQYLTAEERYLAARPMIPAGDLSEVRLADLAADPIGELKRIYRELGLPWSDAYEQRLPSAIAALGRHEQSQHPPLTAAQAANAERIAHLAHAFGHDRPPLARVAFPPSAERPRNAVSGVIRGVTVAAASVAAWPWVEPWFGSVPGLVAMLAGIAIGYAVLGNERSRSFGLGLFAAGAMLTATLVHLALAALDPAFGLDVAWSALNSIATTDRLLWGPAGAYVAWWIASGRPV